MTERCEVCGRFIPWSWWMQWCAFGAETAAFCPTEAVPDDYIERQRWLADNTGRAPVPSARTAAAR